MDHLLNKIHNVDCLEFMQQVPDKYFDLVLTDPPYGINIASNPIRNSHNPKNWDKNIPTVEAFNEIMRISKNQIIWGGNYFNLPPSKSFLVWNKEQPQNFSLAMCELAWTSFDMPAKLFTYSVRLISGKKYHPTMKPIPLFIWCLNMFAKPKCKVFDPFMGSGTTAIAANSLGLSWCGCELEADYVNIANKRLQSVQGDMFGVVA